MKLFWVGYPIFKAIAPLYHFRVTGAENVPRKGPLLVVSNHNSRKDPVAVCLALRRPVHYMAKKELFDPKNSLFEYLMVKLFEAFPVDRDNPGPESIRVAISYLEKGKAVGIFPEGTRHEDKKLHPFHLGAAYFAWKAEVPILPVGIAEEKGVDYHINIGKPFTIPKMSGRPRKVLPEITRLIRQKIWELLPEDWELIEQDVV